MKLPVIKFLYALLKMLGCPVAWELSVGAVLFRLENGRRTYLLLQYPSGHFEFPRGHVDPGESDEETLRRETKEETGITDVTPYPFLTKTKFFYVARTTERERREREGRGYWVFKQVRFYPAITSERDVTLSYEHRSSFWLPYEEALEKLTYPNAKRVLVECERFLKETKDGGRTT